MEGKILLIIDDEQDLCRLLSRTFLKEFEQVECAHTLQEGLEKATSLAPNTILLDNQLPDGYGVQFVRYFKRLPGNAEIVVTSAVDIQHEAMAEGADFFLAKPIRPQLFLERMRSPHYHFSSAA